jgi:hypothetical protein
VLTGFEAFCQLRGSFLDPQLDSRRTICGVIEIQRIRARRIGLLAVLKVDEDDAVFLCYVSADGLRIENRILPVVPWPRPYQ